MNQVMRSPRASVCRVSLIFIVLGAFLAGCGGSSGGSTTPARNDNVGNVAVQPSPPSGGVVIPDAIPACETRNEYTLCITVRDRRITAATVTILRERFFDVYPKLAERFNRGAPLSVYFEVMDHQHLASATGTTVTYSADWLLENPQDHDIVVHELMHVVQSYPDYVVWITEGIADYVRHYYGTNNEAQGWRLEEPGPDATYVRGYGMAARFFIWIEQRYNPELVNRLDALLREGAYNDAKWVQLTGKTVDTLWAEYVADPSLRAEDAITYIVGTG